MNKEQTLANVNNQLWHFFQTVCKFFIKYFCRSCKFEIAVRSCSSQQTSFPNSYYNI